MNAEPKSNPSKGVVRDLVERISRGEVAGLPNVKIPRKQRQVLIANLLIRCLDESDKVRNQSRTVKLSAYEVGALYQEWRQSIRMEDVQE